MLPIVSHFGKLSFSLFARPRRLSATFAAHRKIADVIRGIVRHLILFSIVAHDTFVGVLSKCAFAKIILRISTCAIFMYIAGCVTYWDIFDPHDFTFYIFNS